MRHGSDSTNGADPYSASRIGRGIAHLVGGKAITSIAGIGTFLLLVRELPVEQFAAYSILFALVELVDAFTSVGLGQILSRYVPELYVAHKSAALRRLIALAMTARIGVLAAFLGILYLAVPAVAPMAGLAGWESAAKAYLAVVLLRVTAMSLFSVLESMLHQKIAQIGAGLVTALRFVLIAIVAAQGELDLSTVILIELATEAVGCGIMLIGLMRATPRLDRGDVADGAEWVRANLGRMTDFGLKGYLQHMLIMPFGGSINRLLVGGAMGGAQVALYGFAQSIADLMQRYLPVKLLAGVIRPVLTARYVRDGRFEDLQLAANLIFKVNAIVICLAAVVIVGGGREMVMLVSAGKYGEGSVSLLLLMCALVLMYSLRHMLDHVSHAVERNGPLIWSNAVISLSILPGIALLPTLGVYALPASNVVGLAIGCWVLVRRLRTEGFDYRQDLAGLARISGATLIGIAAAEAARWTVGGSILGATVGILAFAGATATLRPWGPGERQLLGEMARRIRRRPAE